MRVSLGTWRKDIGLGLVVGTGNAEIDAFVLRHADDDPTFFIVSYHAGHRWKALVFLNSKLPDFSFEVQN